MKKRAFSILLAVSVIASMVLGLQMAAGAVVSETVEDSDDDVHYTWVFDENTNTLSYNALSGGRIRFQDDNGKLQDIAPKVKILYFNENVDWIDSDAVDIFENLTDVIVDPNNKYFSSDNGALFSADKTRIRKIAVHTDTFTIPDCVTEIGLYVAGYNTATENIIVPNSVVNIRPIYVGEPYLFAPFYGVENIYFCGTEEDWNNIFLNYDEEPIRIKDAKAIWRGGQSVNYHFNYTYPTAKSISISPNTGNANKKLGENEYEYGTGDLFSFTIVTTDTATEVSICGDKPDETEWHEIPYEYLRDNYNLRAVDNGDGTKTWTCQFYINEPGYRTFKVKVNGNDTDIKTNIHITELPALPTQGGGFVEEKNEDGSVPLKGDVQVNGRNVDFDVKPEIRDGRTLVPLRAIFEALGAEVRWIPESQTVVATRGYDTVVLSIGSNELFSSNGIFELDVPGVIKDGRTLVPIRAISEAFNCDVDWNNDTQDIKIKDSDVQAEYRINEIFLRGIGSTREDLIKMYGYASGIQIAPYRGKVSFTTFDYDPHFYYDIDDHGLGEHFCRGGFTYLEKFIIKNNTSSYSLSVLEDFLGDSTHKYDDEWEYYVYEFSFRNYTVEILTKNEGEFNDGDYVFIYSSEI